MAHLVKVVSSIVVETWVKVQGAESDESAILSAEHFARELVVKKYSPIDPPQCDAEHCVEKADKAGIIINPGCAEVDNPLPNIPTPVEPKAVPDELPGAVPASQVATPPPEGVTIPPGACIVDEKLLGALLALKAAVEFGLENEADEPMIAAMEVFRNLQVTVPPPAHLVAVAQAAIMA